MHRRDLLRVGIASAVATTFPGLFAWPSQVHAATHVMDIVVERVVRPVVSNSPTIIPFWQYLDLATGQAAQIQLLSGDSLTINLSNRLSVPVNMVFPGLLTNVPVCPPGGTVSFSLIAPDNPGSYLFHDDNNGMIGRAMGLGGALIVRPRDGVKRLFDGGPGFNREHLVLFQEIDSRMNWVIDNRGVFDINNFEPDYFYVNGVAYTQGTGVQFMLGLGENVAMRFVNAGLIYYPMHFHGYHVNVATRNRTPEMYIIEKDTISIRPGEVVEAILPVGLQAGLYPLHSHYVPAVTNNGRYAGGGLIMLNAS